MRALLIPATLVLALPCAAQFQAPPVPATPDLVFTLKKPTRYELPKPVQNMIMSSLKQVPSNAAVWREEYSNICEDKEDLRKWLDEVLNTLLHSFGARASADSPTFVLKQLADACDQVRLWIAWNQTGW